MELAGDESHYNYLRRGGNVSRAYERTEMGSEMKKFIYGVLALGIAALPAMGQSAGMGGGASSGQAAGGAQAAMPADPIATSIRNNFKQMGNNLTRSAEKMPEDKYATKLGTQPETRTFAALLGHVINSNYYYCSQAKGEKIPIDKDYEKTPGTKAEMIVAMHAAIDYCAPLYDGLTDVNGMDKVTIQSARGPVQQPKIIPLMRNVVHNNEEYGNIVGYFRSNNIVPPSSEKQ